jgi:hypothetical protein
MLKRTLDPTFLNKVANDPNVHPWLGHEGQIDLAPVAANLDNYLLVDDHGGWVVCKISEGVYEVHTLFLKEGRGPRLVDLIAEGMDYMFTRTDCHTLLTQLPDNNEPARVLATTVGFKEIFRREETPRGPTSYAKITIDEWVQQTSDLERWGEWVHSKRESLGLEDHPYDAAHERAVGAAVQMIRRGNALKGASFYNQWATFAGYPPIQLLGLTPVIIDLGLGIIAEEMDGDMEIIKCPSV